MRVPIEVLPSGKYSVRLPRRLDAKRRRIATCATRDEAERMLAAALEFAAQDRLITPECDTFGEFLRGYLDRRELRGVRAVDSERSVARAYLETAEFATMPLKMIRRPDARAWLDRLQSKPSKRTKKRLSPKTLKNALTLARTCFAEALELGLIDENPLRDLRLHRSAMARTDEPWTHLTPEEQESLLRAVPEHERATVTIAMWTGLRQGEQWALRLEDVHVDGDDPHVVVRYGRRGRPTKNGKIRRVPLWGLGLDAVRTQIESVRSRPNPHQLLCPALMGDRRQPGPPLGWHEWISAAGITRRVRWHDLRHTCASSLVSGWRGAPWELSEISLLLGHADTHMTQRYAHLGATVLGAAVARSIATEVRSSPRSPQENAQSPESIGKKLEFKSRWGRR